jgi:5-methyltetrahydrofolate--homocysteine methyltransferase
MHKNIFTSKLEGIKILVSDGATGTNLFARGLPRGVSAEEWVLEKPEEILALHNDFIESGSDIILTCTFGGSRMRLDHAGLEDRFEEVNGRAVDLALEAAEGTDTLVAGSMGPLGQLLKPFGTLDIEEVQTAYFEQTEVLSKSGVHLILIETQFDINEASSAVLGALNACDLPIICSFSFDRGTKTMMGVSPSDFAKELSTLGVSALGINCGKSLDDNLNALKELSSIANLPIWFKPNAGLPTIDKDGNPTYSVTPEEMGSLAKQWIENGADIIGGCCGTTPEHLRAIASNARIH